MNFYLKNKTYNKVIRAIGVYITLFALIFSLASPEVVNAKTNEVVARVFDTSKIDSVVIEFKSAPFFPKAEDREPRRTMWIFATAYSSDPLQTDSTPCIPADGTNLCERAKAGMNDAIATNILPLGTKVRFPEIYGNKIFTVRDRMNSKYNGQYRIDFYKAVVGEDGEIDKIASKARAVEFGAKQMKMEVM